MKAAMAFMSEMALNKTFKFGENLPKWHIFTKNLNIKLSNMSHKLNFSVIYTLLLVGTIEVVAVYGEVALLLLL